jgi:hypothetical protein
MRLGYNTAGFPQIEQFLEVTGFCRDRRALIKASSFPDTEHVLKVAGFRDPNGVFALRTVDCTRSRRWKQNILNSRISMSGTVLREREDISGRRSVRSDSFYRQNVRRLAGFSCNRELHAFPLPPAYCSSTVLIWKLKSSQPIQNMWAVYGICATAFLMRAKSLVRLQR